MAPLPATGRTTHSGEIVCVIGPNGAGKSTVFKAIYGLIPVRRGTVTFNKAVINAFSPQETLAAGMAIVPQLRSVFPQMSVYENLEMGMFLERDTRRIRRRIDEIFDLFPRLGERASQKVGTMSGGEQRMLEIGRSLMLEPKLVLMDEPSAGLAPSIVKSVFGRIRELNEQIGLTVLMIEQNARQGLATSHRGYVLELGKNTYTGTGQELLDDPEVRRTFLGVRQSDFMARPSRYRWAVLAAATATQMGTAFAFLGIGALAAHFRQDFGLDGARTGLIVTAVALAPLLTMIPVGRLLDRYPATLIITGGALLLGAGVVVVGLADSYLAILGLLFLAGAGYAASQPGGSKVVAEWFPARERGLAMGIRQTGLPLGGAIAAAVLPRVAEGRGLSTALVVAGIVVAATALLFAAVNRSPGQVEVPKASLRHEIGLLLRLSAFRSLLAVGIVMVAVQLSIIVHVMSFLHDSKGIALVDGAWVLFAAQAAGVPGRIVLARWSDHTRSGRVGPLAVALVAAAAAAAAAPWIPGSLAAWLVFASVAGFFSFGWYGPWVVGVAETASGAPLGMTLAAAMTANQISIVLAPPLFGLIFDLTGSWTASWTVLATVVGLVAWHLVRRRLSVGPAAATSQTGSVG